MRKGSGGVGEYFCQTVSKMDRKYVCLEGLKQLSRPRELISSTRLLDFYKVKQLSI